MKWRYEPIKKIKNYLEIEENTSGSETKTAEVEHRVRNTNKLPKSERNASQMKTACKIWKSNEKI